MIETLNTLKDFSPLATIALALVIILMLVRNQQGQNKIADNHLHELPEMLNTLKRIEKGQTKGSDKIINKLDNIENQLTWIKSRINGHE